MKTIATDAAGFFDFRGLSLPGSYLVSAAAESLAPAATDAVELSPARPVVEVSIALTRGFSIAGRVQHENGTPAEDVQVQTVLDMQQIFSGFSPWRNRPRSTRTDEQGAFILENLPAGEFRLVAGQKDAVAPFNPFGGDKGDGSEKVVLDGRGDVTGVVLTIENADAHRIAGVVRDDLGQPVEGVSVRVAGPTDMLMRAAMKATTDGEGRFSAAKLGDGPFRVQATRSGFSSETIGGVRPGTMDLDVTLSRHGWIAGRVVTTDGDVPGAGGTVTARPSRRDVPPGRPKIMEMLGRHDDQRATIGRDGAFRVDAPAGEVQIHVTVPGFAPAVSGPVDVVAGEGHDDIEIVVSVGAVLHGRVVPVGGATGLPGASVAVIPVREGTNLLGQLMPQLFGSDRNTASTGEDGSYEIRFLAAGKYSVTASHDDYAPSEPRVVVVGRDEVKHVATIALATGAILAGKVDDKGNPRAGMTVQVIGVGMALKQGTTDAAGIYRFEGLAAGDYMVNFIDMAAMMKGAMAMKTRTVTLEAGAEQVLDVTFGEGHRIHGKVTGLPPAPVRLIQLRRPGGPAPEDMNPLDPRSAMEASKYTDGVGMIRADGGYAIADIDPGTYILEIPGMPTDPTDLSFYETMDRRPHYRGEIVVEGKDLEHDIGIRP